MVINHGFLTKNHQKTTKKPQKTIFFENYFGFCVFQKRIFPYPRGHLGRFWKEAQSMSGRLESTRGNHTNRSGRVSANLVKGNARKLANICPRLFAPLIRLRSFKKYLVFWVFLWFFGGFWSKNHG